jgi:hypothetical protein
MSPLAKDSRDEARPVKKVMIAGYQPNGRLRQLELRHSCSQRTFIAAMS